MPIRKSNDTLFYLFGTIPVIWLALLLAQSLGGGLPELLRNLTCALEQPTNIVWTNKSLPTILICLAAYGMAVLLYRTNQGRTRDGEEHGSAACSKIGACCSLVNMTREPLVFPLLEREYVKYPSNVSASSNVKSRGLVFNLLISFSF